MTRIKVGRGGRDSCGFDQGRAKLRIVSFLFFQARLLRAERFKGLAYFQRTLASFLRKSNIFIGVLLLLYRGQEKRKAIGIKP